MQNFAKVQVLCSCCEYGSDFFPYPLPVCTTSSIKSEFRKNLRFFPGWVITRDDFVYCPDCVNRLGLKKHQNKIEDIDD